MSNKISSPELFIDENEKILKDHVENAKIIIEIANNKPPAFSQQTIEHLDSPHKLSIEVSQTIDELKEKFGIQAEFPLSIGLATMGAKLANTELVENNAEIQLIAFALTYKQMEHEYHGEDLHDRLVSSIGWLRAVNFAQKSLQAKSLLPPTYKEVKQELRNNDIHLESAYKELTKNNNQLFYEVSDFIISKAEVLELALKKYKEQSSQEQHKGTETLPKREDVLGEDINKLNECLSLANILMPSFIPEPYDNFEDIMDLPVKQAVAYKLNEALKVLYSIGESGLDARSNYSIDMGLRAIGSKLGDPKFHGPKYDTQLVAFALRFYQLSSQEDKEGIIRDRLHNLAIWIRAAALAGNDVYKKGPFTSASELANIINSDPKYLKQAQKELTSYNSAMFEEFYNSVNSCGKIFFECLAEIKKEQDTDFEF